MAKTPIGDILPYNNQPKYAIANSNLNIYGYVNGKLGLQKIGIIKPGQLIGYLDSWYSDNHDIYFSFFPSITDYNNFTNRFSIKYTDYKKIDFPTVPTWKKEGIDFGATSTNIQQIIDRDNKEAESFTNQIVGVAKTGVYIFAGYLLLNLLIRSTNGNK